MNTGFKHSKLPDFIRHRNIIFMFSKNLIKSKWRKVSAQAWITTCSFSVSLSDYTVIWMNSWPFQIFANFPQSFSFFRTSGDLALSGLRSSEQSFFWVCTGSGSPFSLESLLLQEQRGLSLYWNPYSTQAVLAAFLPVYIALHFRATSIKLSYWYAF